MRDQPGAQPEGPRPQRHVLQRRPELLRERRPQTLHAPAFLVDEHRRVETRRRAQRVAQCPDLIRALDVAGEQDESERAHFPEERLLVRRQLKPRAAKDGRAEAAHRVTTGMQSTFSATKAAQKRRASDRSTKPSARRR